MRLPAFGQYMDVRRLFVGILEVKIGGDEIILHHQHRVDKLAGTRHPHLVPGLAFGGGDRYTPFAEYAGDGLCFAAVADAG